MSDVKWIKIATDIFDDDKILLIETLPDADSIIVIWFKLLCLAGKQNNSGVFLLNDRIAYTDKMLATIFRRKEATVQLALKTFEEFGMIEIVDDVITIPNWGKHQNLDKIEAKTEYMRQYMRDYRAKQKLLAGKTNCKTNSEANVSLPDKNIEEDKDKDIDKEKDKKEKRFTPPSVEEVKAYAREKDYHFDAEAFVAFYQSKGWKVGNQPMKDWKSATVTWEKRELKQKQPTKPKGNTLSESMTHGYDMDELRRRAKE